MKKQGRIPTTTYISQELLDLVNQAALEENRSKARQIETMLWEAFAFRTQAGTTDIQQAEAELNAELEIEEKKGDETNPFDAIDREGKAE